MHLELLWTAWLPLVVLGTVRLFRGEAGGARLAGCALAAQFLSCIYYGVFMITLWPLLAGLEWVRTRPPLSRAGWSSPRPGGDRRGGRRRLYAIPYQRARAVVGDREDFEIDKYSAMIESYLVYPPSNRLLGWTAAPDDSELRLAPG